jgi:hypothetical protein
MAKHSKPAPKAEEVPEVQEIIDNVSEPVEDAPMIEEAIAPVSAPATFDLSLITNLEQLLALAEEAKKRAEALKFNRMTEAVTQLEYEFDKVKKIYNETGIDEENRRKLSDLMREISPLTASLNYSNPEFGKPKGTRKPRKTNSDAEPKPLTDAQRSIKERVLADLRSRVDFTGSKQVAASIAEDKADVLACLKYLAYFHSDMVERRGNVATLQFRAVR